MEEDDEFGDLYTDVLRPFTSSLCSAPQPQQPSTEPSSTHRSIDLNIKTDDVEEETICAAAYSNSAPPLQRPDKQVSSQSVGNVQESEPAGASDSTRVLIERAEEPLLKQEGDSIDGVRLVEGQVLELPKRVLEDVNCGSEFYDVDGNRRDDVVKDVNLDEKDVKFDIEEDNYETDDVGSEPIIPGLSSAGGGDGDDNRDDRALVPGLGMNSDVSTRYVLNDDDRGEGDDWDSDSEDDLQIVLNDNNNGNLAVERGAALGDGVDEDEDADGLVIVANGDSNQSVEEQPWGEDAALAADGKRKETNDAGKAGIGSAVAAKSMYSGYHPYHSQFKYVRPGATPVPGATTSAPGGHASQVRPMVNMGLVSGRGRGDWRPAAMKNAPPMHKGFYSGAGQPSWNAGRVFGGVEFTLPSHKTIFDVDIDGFEEKPWKYPGVESSDFFNFGLNEESWKEYCKQLEQLRLESTMQSKIRVYESGRTEQEYDPDMPPELAAAAGIHDVAHENSHSFKPDDGPNDVARGSTRMRPPLPTGRAIQVETGSGERLPSIDTRPPRIRDSDAIIEIVLQDSVDDGSSTAAGVQEHLDNDPREALGDEDDVNQDESDYYDSYTQVYDGCKREKTERKKPDTHSAPNGIPEQGFVTEEKTQCRSRSNTPEYSGGKHGSESAYEERELPERVHDRSPHSTSSQDLKVDDNLNEESVESLEGKQDVHVSPFTDREALDPILDPVKAIESSSLDDDEIHSNTAEKSAAFRDGVKSQKLTSQVEQPPVQELDDGEDSKATRNSDNSRGRSGSSRDYLKRREGFDEEVIQDSVSDRVSSIKRHLDGSEHISRRRGLEGQLERKHPVKARDDFYPYRESDPSLGHQLHMKPDEFERQKDRENPDGGWLLRDDDPYVRRNRNEDDRKKGRNEEMGSRRRAKPRENERSNKDDSQFSRKQLDNGGYRVHHDKDGLSRHRAREDVPKSRHENVEDYHNKKRKDEEYYRREYVEKEENYREDAIRRRKERDEVVDQRKRDDLLRIRDSVDDHYTSRHKEDGWIQRERVDRLRDKLKAHEENPPRRERDEGRGLVRSERGIAEKSWPGQTREKSELRVLEKEDKFKDTLRRSDQSKKRDRADDANLHYRGRDDSYSRINVDEKQSRQEKSGIRNDRANIASDNQKFDKSRDSTRKNKELDATRSSMMGPSRRILEDQRGQSSEMGFRGSSDQGHNAHEIAVHSLAKRRRDAVSSDEELQDSRRGRSKLERWTSHKERDFSNGSKSSSLKFKEIDGNKVGVSSESCKPAKGSVKPVKESFKTTGVSENQHSERKDDGDVENKNETKQLADRHLDTVEKLKKRSERFKLPLPSEKEAVGTKKLDNEQLPSSTKTENPVESEVKHERPPRKRRWISN